MKGEELEMADTYVLDVGSKGFKLKPSTTVKEGCLKINPKDLDFLIEQKVFG